MKHLSGLRRLLGRLLVCLSVGTTMAHAASPLVVAIVPQLSTEQIMRDWGPVLKAVEKSTGIALQLRFYSSIPGFEAALLKGELDVAYMNPYHVAMARRAQGFEPIIRDDAQRLTGLLLVPRDSTITSVRQLDGATTAFPAPNAFGASLYMRALLAEQVKIRVMPSYVKTHANVYRQVVSGQAAAGGTIGAVLAKERPELQSLLRVIYETPPAYPHPLAVHPRVPVHQREALQEAFLALAKVGGGAALLAAIQMPVPVKTTYADYAPLERLGLERYVILKED